MNGDLSFSVQLDPSGHRVGGQGALGSLDITLSLEWGTPEVWAYVSDAQVYAAVLAVE